MLGGTMATNLALDDELILKAQEVGAHKSKKEAVNAALREYIEHRRQLKIIESFDKVKFDASYDYKKQRNKK
jgi:Arc/MetJ family transcription regulator